MMDRPNEKSPPGLTGSGSEIAGPVAWEAEFREQVAAVEKAARAWGVRPDSLEGRFVGALLTATGSLGRLCGSALASLETLARENREAAERELAAAREIIRAAKAGLKDADSMQTVVEIKRENLVVKMIQEALPLFAERLKDVLVIKERYVNDDIKRRRFATAVLFGLAIYFAGYGTHVWQTWGGMSAFDWCWAHPLSSGGRVYCDMTGFGLAAQ